MFKACPGALGVLELLQLCHAYFLADIHVNMSTSRSFLTLYKCEHADCLFKVLISKLVGIALEHFNSHGIVRRDFKPENILLSSCPSVSPRNIIDVGIAQRLSAVDAEPNREQSKC